MNDNNPLFLLIWKTNIDCQYIREDSSILSRCVTSFQTKTDKNEAEVIWENVDQNKSKYENYTSAGLYLRRKRDIGVYECANKLLGHHLFDASDKVIWVVTEFQCIRGHIMKSKHDLEKSWIIYKTCYENMAENSSPGRP